MKRQDKMYTPHEVRKVAVEAEVDPRTVEHYLAGIHVRLAVSRKIQEALKRIALPVVP